MSSSLIGRRLGKYEIIELIGQGGMATVYKGYQPDIDRFVAVKVLPPHPGQDRMFIERFRLEARTIAQLQHPHILPMHDYGGDADVLYLVMAYVNGGSLKDRIERGPLPLHDAETILRQIASALDYAHRRGVIHRDIKPDNILLDEEGHALLADFGIVKIMEGESTSGLTATGGVLGTPAYMAPEQSQGMSTGPQADIYSLGVIVYEMITGRQPYQADTPMQVMLKHITDPVPSPLEVSAGLPSALEPVMLRVLAKHPEDRYGSATEFAQEFLRAIHRDSSSFTLKESLPTKESVPTTPPQRTPTPESAMPVMIQNPSASGTGPQTAAVASGTNPLLLLGGFAIIALLAVIIVLLVVNGNPRTAGIAAIPTATAVPATLTATLEPTAVIAAGPTVPAIKSFGRLSYTTTNQLGDTINLQVNGLAQPSSTVEYAVWLKNTGDDSVLPIGVLSLDGLGNGVHSFVDDEGRALPTLFNAVLITAESEVGDAPSGKVVYSGSTPDRVRAALSEIFVASDQGFSGGSLFGGALAEAELSIIHTSFDHGTHDTFGLHNRTEHTMNILMNTEIDYDGNGLAENPGYKLGLRYFLDGIEARLNFDYSLPGMRPDLRSDVDRVEACIRNTRQRLDEMYALETGWAKITEDVTEAFAESEIRKSEGMIKDLIEGVDRNSNNQVEGFFGECGLRQIPTYGLLVGSLTIVEGDLTA
ncbi:MAG: serine/threonine protein kinase [Anaerolineae bacterium]|nr:serine/threonine protein kinase [Anaerolineae bacterium]